MSDEELKKIFATTASICTVLQFLSGTLTCQKIVRNKSTGEISAFPFVSGCLSTSLWLQYGLLIQDTSMILVNTIGVFLFLSYVVVFFLYSVKKLHVLRQFLFCLLIFIIVIIKLHRVEDGQIARSFLGRTCMIVTILFFAAPFATIIHVMKVRNTESLPYHLIVSTFIVCLQWMVYGVLLKDPFIQIPNFLGCVLSGLQLTFFMVYPSKSNNNSTCKVHSSNVI